MRRDVALKGAGVVDLVEELREDLHEGVVDAPRVLLPQEKVAKRRHAVQRLHDDVDVVVGLDVVQAHDT